MPPRRPLPDLCLIVAFKMLTPNEQMVASRMSSRCAVLVRAANRTVKTLIITNRQEDDPSILEDIDDYSGTYSLAFEPAVKALMEIPGEPSFPHYPVTTARLAKWNCLVVDSAKQFDTATIEQIVNLFSAVTELKLLLIDSVRLVPLLQHPTWQCQLANLMVDWIDSQQDRELITAINGLTALQYLSIDCGNTIDLSHLTIVAQLKQVVYRSAYLKAFLRSLEQHATDNADLQIHLISGDTEALLSLSQPLHSRIVIYGSGSLNYTGDQVPLLCRQFRSLTSLYFGSIAVADFAPLFTALSQLHQLVHLELEIFWKSKEELPPAARPLARLNSVRALSLYLRIGSHSQLQWLNLQATMPNLKAICIGNFRCQGCRFEFNHSSLPLPWQFQISPARALHCFPSSLFTLHPGVPLNRFILCLKEECISAEKLLPQLESDVESQSSPWMNAFQKVTSLL